MKVLNTLIVALCLSQVSQQAILKELPSTYIPAASNIDPLIDSLKTNAFKILTTKCNTCHVKRNRRRVFTLKNMNPWVDDIHTQVFIKKRMPKGRKNKLTNKEYQHLRRWIASIKNQN